MSSAPPVIALVLGAGRSRRMAALATDGGPVNKMLLETQGRPVLSWTLEVFERCPRVVRTYVTASADDVDAYRQQVARDGLGKVAAVIEGGAERQESVFRALRHIAAHDPLAATSPLVAIHDGARPLLGDDALLRVLDAATVGDGALLCVPAKETVKRILPDHTVAETIPRETLMVAQTPQVFRLGAILDAHERALAEGFAATDDAMLIERLGGRVGVVVGDYDNIKITTPEDLVLLEGFVQRRQPRVGV